MTTLVRFSLQMERYAGTSVPTDEQSTTAVSRFCHGGTGDVKEAGFATRRGGLQSRPPRKRAAAAVFTFQRLTALDGGLAFGTSAGKAREVTGR